MATLTLDRGNFILIGTDEDGEYKERFGEILDFREDESEPGTHWLKIKMLVDINTTTKINLIKNYSSSVLGSIPKLEVYDTQEGTSILKHFDEVIDARNGRREDQPETDTIVEDQSETDTIDEEQPEHSDDQASDNEETTIGLMPTWISEDDSEIQPEVKPFDINLATGDMKTIMKIAEKNPSRVFNVIDRAIIENGHQSLDYINEPLRKIFIDLKINKTKTYTKLMLEKNTSYVFKTQTNHFYAYYLGGNFWVIPEDPAVTGTITAGFKQIDSSIMNQYIVLPAIDNQSDVLEMCQDILSQIDSDFKREMETRTQNISIEVKTSDIDAAITEEMLGKEWVDAITYYYFMGGDMEWDLFDLKTFSTAASILKMATARDDESATKQLQAA